MRVLCALARLVYAIVHALHSDLLGQHGGCVLPSSVRDGARLGLDEERPDRQRKEMLHEGGSELTSILRLAMLSNFCDGIVGTDTVGIAELPGHNYIKGFFHPGTGFGIEGVG